MSVKSALNVFVENNKKAQESLHALREEVKREGSFKIQRYMLNNQFEEAQNIMKHLEEFSAVELESNASYISETITTLFIDNNQFDTTEDTTYKTNMVIEDELSFVEREIIEEIGYNAVSRLKDMKTKVTEQNLYTLEQKGYLKIENVRWGHDAFLVFELTEKGKVYFQTRYGLEAGHSTPYPEVELDIELVQNKLKVGGYQILGVKDELIEFQMDNKSCYMMIPMESMSLQMDRYSQYKNLGVICKDEEQLAKAYSQTNEWVEHNKVKSKFLSVHFTTIQAMEKNPNEAFKTLRAGR
ncbi:hypothetical protein CN918_32610 [Priestia megaterium]|nr:hypothetical protein CN918_32610 [Priestia megaterium]